MCKWAFSLYLVSIKSLFSLSIGGKQGDQIGQNFAIWVIYYGIGQIFF